MLMIEEITIRSQAIFPLNWVSQKFELSLKLGRSQAKVGVLYLECVIIWWNDITPK